VQIVPTNGLLLVNDEPQKTFEEILPEIMISKYMIFCLVYFLYGFNHALQ